MSTGFADAPVSRSLVYGLVGASILVSITDVKHYFYIQVDPHLWRYHQIWRILIYQFCYTNSTEVLFAAMTFYNMRVIERLWGSRKYAVRPSRMRFISGVTTDEMVVFHPSSLRAHHIHHSRPARSPLPAPLLQHIQLPPRRPHRHHIRSPRPISRRHPTRLQVPNRGILLAPYLRALHRRNPLR